jgi:hypothetical protein
MDFSTLVGLGQVGLGLFGAFKGRQQSQDQESFYDIQTTINKGIGTFNAEVSLRTGTESVNGIALMTRKLLGEQRATFAGRGISLEGSPMILLGETVNMGKKQAQEAYFNSEVQAINARANTLGAVSRSENLANAAKFNTLTNTINMAQQIMSLSNIGQYYKSTGVAPNFNLFKWWSS